MGRAPMVVGALLPGLCMGGCRGSSWEVIEAGDVMVWEVCRKRSLLGRGSWGPLICGHDVGGLCIAVSGPPNVRVGLG